MIVQLVNVAVPSAMASPPPVRAELPLTVQSVIVSDPFPLHTPPPVPRAGVELPLTLQSDSVSTPWLFRPPPVLLLPPVIVSREIDAVTPASIWNTRLSP